MMLLGIFKNTEGKQESNIYYDWSEWHKDTFSPATEIKGVLEFKIEGKNYTERKASLQDIAMEWQAQFSGYAWSYGELAEIYSFLEKNAKRYGLLREFKENGII